MTTGRINQVSVVTEWHPRAPPDSLAEACVTYTDPSDLDAEQSAPVRLHWASVSDAL